MQTPAPREPALSGHSWHGCVGQLPTPSEVGQVCVTGHVQGTVPFGCVDVTKAA